jgi:type IV secretion system protein VirD4
MTMRMPLTVRLGSFAALSILSLSVGTQWLAHRLDDQPALGRPLFHLAAMSIYCPTDVLVWWLRYGKAAPRLFDEAGAIVVVGQLLAMLGTYLAGAMMSGGRVTTTYGSARWATQAEIERAGLFARDGIILGAFGQRYVRHDDAGHVLLIAPTRSGKGVGVVIPTLLGWTRSVVVHDLKGEQWRTTAGWRSLFSHCLYFDPTDSRSAQFNPLLEVRKGDQEVRDVQNIADVLVDPEGRLDHRSHWEKTSHSLLVGAILHILYVGEAKTLAAVAALLSRVDQPFTQTLEEMLKTAHLQRDGVPQVHPVVASCARELLDKSENERSGILSTAVSFLSLYKDPVVAAVTADSDWRIEQLVDDPHPVSLYLVVPPSDISRTRPLIRLILNQICRRLTERLPLSDEARLLLLLDEFPALGRLDFFETSLAFLAGYGIRALLVAQSANQLVKAYGEAHAIADNCAVRIAFAANDERTARRLSDILGTATEQRIMRNFSGPRSALWLPNTSVSEQETARPLLTPGEIVQLPQDEALIQVSGLAPFRASKLRYYDHPAFRARCIAPPSLRPAGYEDRPAERPHDWPVTAPVTPKNPSELVEQSVAVVSASHPTARRHPAPPAAVSGDLGLAEGLSRTSDGLLL